MRWHGNKKVTGVYHGPAAIRSIYKGTRLVWTDVGNVWRGRDKWRRHEKW